MAKILFLEDEENIGQTLYERLQEEGFQVDYVSTVFEAASLCKSNVYDLFLLDVMLPDGTGFQFLENQMKFNKNCKAIFLSALDQAEHRIQGLEIGALDYLPKPFHFKELLLRIKKVLRFDSVEQTQDLVFTFKNVKVDLQGYWIEREGVKSKLSKKERDLLLLFFSRPHQVIRREEMIEKVWPNEKEPTLRTVDNFIVKLRKLLEEEGSSQSIQSVRGVGYQFNGEFKK